MQGAFMQLRFAIFIITMTFSHAVLAGPILTVSTDNLALSVKGLILNGQPSGLDRMITITNKGNTPTSGLTINSPSWPSGTSVNTSESTCTQGKILAAGDSCTITITPGTLATLGSNNKPCTTAIAPIPNVLSVSANNTNTISTNVVVLGYGCIYQEGYIYSISETANISKSIGGSITALKDQAPIYPDGVIWSSNGNGTAESDVSTVSILGIDILSTTSNPSPISPPYPVGTPFYAFCHGNSDGICDTQNIVSYYNYNRTNGGNAPTPLTYYAAGLCSNYRVDSSGNSPCTQDTCYKDWYLPAICEMGPDTDGSGCAPKMQNIVNNIPDLIGDPKIKTINSCKLGTDCLAGDYWSSTEGKISPKLSAWYESFASSGNSFQFDTLKKIPLGVRCSRALSV